LSPPGRPEGEWAQPAGTPGRRWLAAALLWLLSALTAAAAHAADPAAPAVTDPAQQILVLLPMAPPHFRPDGDYGGGYADGPGRVARRRAAAQLAREHGLGLARDWPIPDLGVDCYVMDVPPGQQPERTAEALARNPHVAWAQAMHVYRAQQHADPLYALQPAATAWHLAHLHRLATGRRVRVAVIDSGIEPAHPDLAGQIELSENFVAGRPWAAESHGTAVAGIIAARADNQAGIVGVAPDARLLALRACWQESERATLCTSLSLAMALDYAVRHGARVINLSLSGPPDALLGKLIDAALERGIAVVSAVDRALPGGGYPASHPGVVAVADEGGGPLPAGAVLAPGHDVPTTVPPARWTFVSGASYAAAHVSGLLALTREGAERQPAQPAAAVLVRLSTGAIDACATVQAGPASCACECALTSAGAPAAPR
jgi:subtilisin family serine protease